MTVLLVPYHLDEYLPDLDVPVPPDRVITSDAGSTRAERMAGLFTALAEAIAAEPADTTSRLTVLTSDCTAAVAVVAGLQRRGVDPAVVWFDAHGDLNTPASSTSGYLGGMALRNLLTDGDPTFGDGLGLRRITPDRAVLVDGRDLDPPEVDYLAASDVRLTTVGALARGDGDLPDGPLYLHVDMDVVDGTASFNAFSPAISTGMFDVVAPNASTTEAVSVNKAEWATTPALGLMIVSHDNRSADEAQTVTVPVKLP